MGREVRMVPKDWQHPKDGKGDFVPLLKNFARDRAAFDEMAKDKGLDEAVDYFDGVPMARDYMPEFGETATHYMMYENTSEGTPISPAFETPEELAHWLADTKASAFASQTASYESWLRVCLGGYAPSAVMIGGVLKSGVEGLE